MTLFKISYFNIVGYFYVVAKDPTGAAVKVFDHMANNSEIYKGKIGNLKMIEVVADANIFNNDVLLT